MLSLRWAMFSRIQRRSMRLSLDSKFSPRSRRHPTKLCQALRPFSLDRPHPIRLCPRRSRILSRKSLGRLHLTVSPPQQHHFHRRRWFLVSRIPTT